MSLVVRSVTNTRRQPGMENVLVPSIRLVHQWKGSTWTSLVHCQTPRGKMNILMMVDQFTKWVECIPLPTQTAEETARAAVDHFFSRLGLPFQVFSDQGRCFESKLFGELCKVLHIHKARTTPYRPSANMPGREIQQNSYGCSAVIYRKGTL